MLPGRRSPGLPGLLAAALVATVPARLALADCGPPPVDLELHWPADGETGVATNARIFVLNFATEVRVEGAPIAFVAAGEWDPGPLLPATTYSVEFDTVDWLEGPVVATGSFTFTTGAGPFEPAGPPGPTLPAPSCDPGVVPTWDSVCFRVAGDNCLDDCTNGYARVDLHEEDAVVWRLSMTPGSYRGLVLAGCPDLGMHHCAGWPADSAIEALALGPDGSVLAERVAPLPAPACLPDGGFPPLPPPEEDAGPAPDDDAGAPGIDAGEPAIDGGPSVRDAGEEVDAGASPGDDASCSCTVAHGDVDTGIALALLAPGGGGIAARRRRRR